MRQSLLTLAVGIEDFMKEAGDRPYRKLVEHHLRRQSTDHLRLGAVVTRFEFSRRQVAERLEHAPRVEPIDPGQRREFHGVESAPGTQSSNHLRLEEPNHRLAEGIVEGVTTAADGRRCARHAIVNSRSTAS